MHGMTSYRAPRMHWMADLRSEKEKRLRIQQRLAIKLRERLGIMDSAGDMIGGRS